MHKSQSFLRDFNEVGLYEGRLNRLARYEDFETSNQDLKVQNQHLNMDLTDLRPPDPLTVNR